MAPEGRISPYDLGLWNDKQIEPLARIARFAQEQGCVAGLQLAHAGRKASVGAGWQAQKSLHENEGGWLPVGPSSIAYGDDYVMPRELDAIGISPDYRPVCGRCPPGARSRFPGRGDPCGAWPICCISFLSPLSNQRTGTPTAAASKTVRAWCARWLLRLRAGMAGSAASADSPVGHRLGRRRLERRRDGRIVPRTQRTRCRSGQMFRPAGMLPTAKMPIGPGYQTEFAERVRHEAGIPTSAVGLITSPAPGRSHRPQRPGRPGLRGPGNPAQSLLAAECRPGPGANGGLAGAVSARRTGRFHGALRAATPQPINRSIRQRSHR